MQHHFVLMFNAETKTWIWDTDTEGAVFHGTVYNPETDEWQGEHLEDGSFLPYTDYACVAISAAVKLLNETVEDAQE